MGRLTGSQVATCGVLELEILTVMKVLVAICFLAISARAQVGPSGIVNPDGTLIQFTRDQADNIAVIGPSGIVTKGGSNAQLPSGQDHFTAADIPTPVAKSKAALPTSPLIAGLAGPSGIVSEKGNTQFTREFADNIAVAGPSGVVTKDGRNIQFRTKRSAHNIGASGIILADGTPVQLIKGGEGVYIVNEGPSGIILSDGTLVQKRAKRSTEHLVGASGVVASNGQLIQLPAGVTVAAAGPSGLVLSNGQNVQLRAKRSTEHLVGASGIITNDGQLIQLPAGVTVVSAGPSGIVLSNGQNIQLL